MKKKIIIILIIVAVIILFIPRPLYLNDGGTVEYKALTYKISKVHKLNDKSTTGYEDGWIIEILGFELYNNVSYEMIENSNINEDDEQEIIEWNEISANGVDEDLLLENLDLDDLEKIESLLKSLCNEINEKEENLTKWYNYILESEQFNEVINMKEKALKPLYTIIYKSSNQGLYEYICSIALARLSGFDFDEETENWATSKQFLELFNKKVISSREN